MSKKHITVLIAVLATFGVPTVKAQTEVHFSQFYECSILRNPALTGVFEDDYKISCFTRNQWAFLSKPFQTFLCNAETHISIGRSEDYMSFGLLGFSDVSGTVHQSFTGFYPAINYHKSINPTANSFLSVGFAGGYLQSSYKLANATFENQYVAGAYDPLNPSLENIPNSKLNTWDIGAGINFNTNAGRNDGTTYMIGLSGYHLAQPAFSYFNTQNIHTNIRWNGNAALVTELGKNAKLQLQMNYSRTGKIYELVGGGLLAWTFADTRDKTVLSFAVGVLARLNDAIIPVTKIKYKNVGVGVSYDVNYSTLQPASNYKGGLEINLGISGNYKKTFSKDPGVCPRF